MALPKALHGHPSNPPGTHPMISTTRHIGHLKYADRWQDYNLLLLDPSTRTSDLLECLERVDAVQVTRPHLHLSSPLLFPHY